MLPKKEDFPRWMQHEYVAEKRKYAITNSVELAASRVRYLYASIQIAQNWPLSEYAICMPAYK